MNTHTHMISRPKAQEKETVQKQRFWNFNSLITSLKLEREKDKNNSRFQRDTEQLVPG